MIPRPYQTEAAEAIWEALKTQRKVGAVLPTGGGKSLVETILIDRLAEGLGFNQCIIVVCHIGDVVDQLHLGYCKFGKFGKASIKLSRQSKPRIGTKIIFCTVQMLLTKSSRSYWATDPMRKDAVAVIIDEAHSFGSDSYDIMDHALFPFAKMIGFSATPYRKNLYSFSQFDSVAYAIDSKTLIEQGWLCPPKLFELNMGGMPKAERFASVVKIWKEKEKGRDLVSVVYLRNKTEAQEMLLVAEEAGLSCVFVSGDHSIGFCRDLYQKAKEGSLDMIVNVRKLETGIDIPNIGSIFMPFGTNSVTTYLQRIGRALRPWQGKDRAHIYVFGDSPSIQSGKWTRLHQDAMTAKEPLTAIDSLYDELQEQIDEGASIHRIAWTREAINACEILISGNMKSVAELIAERKFPLKYSKAIAKLAPYISTAKVERTGESISEAQTADLIKKHNFRHEDAARLSGGEAEAILAALKCFLTRDPFILQSGNYAGQHISDTPPMYRKFMKDPATIGLWRAWKKAGSPPEGEG